MIEACSSCGYTVDPKCEVCKGEGEYDARAAVPLVNAVRIASDDAVQRKIKAGSQVIDEDTATVMEALDFGQFSEDMLCGVLAGGAARGIARPTQQALSRYLQRQYDALYACHTNPTHAQAGGTPPVQAEATKAIDLIGCALVALKASVPLRHSPHVLLGRRKKAEGLDLWVLPGGKQDSNESPEDCVRRETKEEIGVSRLVGLRPVSFSYNSENPNRKFLMLYFTAYVAGEEPKIVAEHEFSDLRWFSVDALPAEMWQSDRDAITNTLLMRPR